MPRHRGETLAEFTLEPRRNSTIPDGNARAMSKVLEVFANSCWKSWRNRREEKEPAGKD